MKRSFLIVVLALFSISAGSQCVSVRSAVTICQGSTLASLGGSMLGGTTSVFWSDNGVGGFFSPNLNVLTADWTPPPSFAGTATLTLTSTAGCIGLIKSASFNVTVQPLPSATISYSGTPFCKSVTSAQPVTRTGTSGGKYSSAKGLTINANSGAITPSTSTAGTYIVTYTISASGACAAVTATTSVRVEDNPSPPAIGIIIQPTCTVATGSTALSGLPPSGIWTVSSTPAGANSTGTGTTTNISNISSGTYTFIVANSDNCSSAPSNAVIINPQPVIPTAPVVGTITQPTCSLATGSLILNGLPGTGSWTITMNPGNITTPGTGTSITLSALGPGTYTFTVTSSSGCTSPSSANVTINSQDSPTAPVVGTITQPTCAISTGSVELSGLPSSGSWTLTRSPGSVTISGSGTSVTVTTLLSGTYTFIVTNAKGCISSQSGNVVINPQPSLPAPPAVGIITPPTCTIPTGSVVLSGLPSAGIWTLIRYPGTVVTTGTGTSTTISVLLSGIYNFTVTSAEGCLSSPSPNVIIPSPPGSPDIPSIGVITQPTLLVPTGSVVLNNLPATGNWIIKTLPGGSTISGSGSTKTISGLNAGTYTFIVSNSSGCSSAESVPVVISNPAIPVLTITNPAPVCYPTTVNLTSPAITAGSSPDLTFSYWTNIQATIVYSSSTSATAGTYYIKGTNTSGFYNIKPVVVSVDRSPVPNAGPDQILEYQFTATLDATLDPNQTGIWSVTLGSAVIDNTETPNASVSNLSLGNNLFVWTVKQGSCPPVSDTMKIHVNKLVNPTLITPNMDGKNDYFIVKMLSSMGKTELIVFDRRGVNVFKDPDYENNWNGVDFNKRPLPDDTYFYILKSQKGNSMSGYIVIRR